VDLKMPVGELFAQGAIEVMVTAVNGAQVKLGIHADPRFLILREELCVREPEVVGGADQTSVKAVSSRA